MNGSKALFRVALTAFAVYTLAATLTACGGEVPAEYGSIAAVSEHSMNDSETDAKAFLYAVVERVSGYDSYKVSVTGKVNAKKWMISYDQELENTIIKCGDEIYYKSVSDAVISSEHEMYTDGRNAVYRTSLDGKFKRVSVEKYLEAFGVIPTRDLCGYIVGDETVLSAEKLCDNDDGTSTYRYVLDGKTATRNIALQTKEFGGLSGYPAFKNVEITITADSDGNPYHIKTKNRYNISLTLLGNCDCVQEVSMSYGNINGEVEIPEADKFRRLASDEQ